MASTTSDPGAGRVPNIHTKTDARVHLADMRQDVLRAGEVLVFGTMIVNGYLDVVLLHEALDARERLRGGAHDHERHAAAYSKWKRIWSSSSLSK